MADSDGLPFIGSLLSLLSSGDVRYTGLLHQVDMENSTLALSNGEQRGSSEASERASATARLAPSTRVFTFPYALIMLESDRRAAESRPCAIDESELLLRGPVTTIACTPVIVSSEMPRR